MQGREPVPGGMGRLSRRGTALDSAIPASRTCRTSVAARVAAAGSAWSAVALAPSGSLTAVLAGDWAAARTEAATSTWAARRRISSGCPMSRSSVRANSPSGVLSLSTAYSPNTTHSTETGYAIVNGTTNGDYYGFMLGLLRRWDGLGQFVCLLFGQSVSRVGPRSHPRRPLRRGRSVPSPL